MSEGLRSERSETTEDARKGVGVNSVTPYKFVKESYHGSGHYRDGYYIVPHPREMKYNTRRLLSFYKNFIKPISDARVNPIFSQEIVRQVQNENGKTIEKNMFTEFLNNVDNSGNTMQAFSKRYMAEAGLQGMAFIVMENFSKEEKARTVDDAMKDRKFPYVYMETKEDVVHVLLDRFGNIEEIAFVDYPELVKTGDGHTKAEPRYRMWTNQYSQRMKARKKSLVMKGLEKIVLMSEPQKIDLESAEEPVFHNLGIVPVKPVYVQNREDKRKLVVESPFFDMAKMNWTIFNLDSEMRELIRNQGFSLLYIQTDETGPQTQGTYNYIRVPFDAKFAPGFASPDAAIPKTLMDYMESIRINIFEIAEQNGVTGVQTQKSGEAKAWDFQAHGDVLKDMAMISKDAEEWIAETFKLYLPSEKFTYVVVYRDDYTPKATEIDVKLYQSVLMENIGPETNRLAYKKMVSEVFSDVKAEALAPVLEEIDGLSDDELMSEAGKEDGGDDKGGGDGGDTE